MHPPLDPPLLKHNGKSGTGLENEWSSIMFINCSSVSTIELYFGNVASVWYFFCSFNVNFEGKSQGPYNYIY